MNRSWITMAALILAAGTAAAQEPDLPPPPPIDGGTQAFRAVLHFAGMKPIGSLSEAYDRPKESIIVLFGPNYDRDLGHGNLAQFVERGGALLVLSDQHVSEAIDVQFGITITRARVRGPENDPSAIYRGTLDQCPIVRHPTSGTRAQPLYPFQLLKHVATNRPSFLHAAPSSAKVNVWPMAYMPDHCWWMSMRGRNRHTDGDPPVFAAGGTIGSGRFLFMADHSLFINTMMLQTDNDNIQYALAVVEWLGDNGKRKNAFFSEEGMTRTQFDLDLDQMTPPLPHPDVLGPVIDQFVQGIESEGVFDRLIQDKIPTRVIMRTLLLAASVLVVAFALYFVTAARLRIDPRAPRLPDQLAGLADPALPAELRRRDCHAVDARELVRRTFEEWGMTAPVVHSGGVIARRLWARRIARLVAIEVGNDASPPALVDLARELTAVHGAVARGEIRLRSA